MRIAQVAPLAESVPPKFYGGTERVVSWLTEDLVELGHKVTLFASGDSLTRGCLVPVWPSALRLGRPRVDPIVAQTMSLQLLAERAGEFDIIHFHIDWVHLPLMRHLGVPFLTTLHGRLDLPGLTVLVSGFPNAPFVSISESQQAPLSEANWGGTVYHGMPPDLLCPCYGPEGYLAFLGRLSPEKGAEAAIRIARHAKMPLRISAKIPRDGSRYFREKIEPQLDDQVRFVGELKDPEKQQFLGRATALLFPIEWPEPFGLVMIEAMACGTPVIAFRRGSVPEVVEHGASGFIVDDEPEAIAALSRIDRLDRHKVRQAFERRFLTRRMTDDYLRIYRTLLYRGQDELVPASATPQKRDHLHAEHIAYR
jgi:glycosyltransferase involved in cell wall biosynthesis